MVSVWATAGTANQAAGDLPLAADGGGGSSYEQQAEKYSSGGGGDARRSDHVGL
jgi:hypothetical protein